MACPDDEQARRVDSPGHSLQLPVGGPGLSVPAVVLLHEPLVPVVVAGVPVLLPAVGGVLGDGGVGDEVGGVAERPGRLLRSSPN